MGQASRNPWIDHLRSTITVLVVAHHSSLAYTTFAKFDSQAYIRSTHPIVDTHRWKGLDIFENFNDVFFMFLMFFISGLFMQRSIAAKGVPKFLKDRTYRLLLPFLFGGTLLMLIAYFPAYYTATHDTSLKNYIKDFFTVEAWPVGPPWFIAVLFAFNLLYTLFHKLIKPTNLNHPFKFFGLLFILTWILYVPIADKIGAGTWTGWGPFDFQLSRILTYFGYFLLGALAQDGPQSNHWKTWVVLALACYTALTIYPFTTWMSYYTVYVASCTLSCVAFLTAFKAKANIPSKTWTSLSRNAYRIYLLHYPFVTWTQFLLLNTTLPAMLKFLIVFITSLFASWGLSSAISPNTSPSNPPPTPVA
ncbi:MAG: acyltransferase [Bacteroidetes bacterium]|nr:acyltransferase [Bacteroidota bacterium]